MGRSILAVTIGYIVSVLLVMTTFLLVGQVTQSLLVGDTANPELIENISIVVQFFSLFYAIAGGYTTARLVKDKKVQHAVALGIVMISIAILSILSNEAGLPPWWHIVFLALVIPASALGGLLNARGKTKRKR